MPQLRVIQGGRDDDEARQLITDHIAPLVDFMRVAAIEGDVEGVKLHAEAVRDAVEFLATGKLPA